MRLDAAKEHLLSFRTRKCWLRVLQARTRWHRGPRILSVVRLYFPVLSYVEALVGNSERNSFKFVPWRHHCDMSYRQSHISIMDALHNDHIVLAVACHMYCVTVALVEHVDRPPDGSATSADREATQTE